MTDADSLSSRAAKLASRIQRLPNGRAYDIMVVKSRDEWLLIIRRQGEEGLKVEKLR